jgi:hypothetical protein
LIEERWSAYYAAAQDHLNYCLQPAGRACAVCMHVHEDAFVRVAWGRLPFADSVLWGGERVLLIGASPVDRYQRQDGDTVGEIGELQLSSCLQLMQSVDVEARFCRCA